MADSVNNYGALAWSIAELLRGDYKQSGYQKVIPEEAVVTTSVVNRVTQVLVDHSRMEERSTSRYVTPENA